MNLLTLCLKCGTCVCVGGMLLSARNSDSMLVCRAGSKTQPSYWSSMLLLELGMHSIRSTCAATLKLNHSNVSKFSGYFILQMWWIFGASQICMYG